MKIKNYQYKISELRQINLSKNIGFPLLDFESLINYVNYKTFKINGLYLKLLPIKISDLKTLKNSLLKDYSYYAKTSDYIKTQDYFKLDLFKKEFPKEYKNLLGITQQATSDQTSETEKQNLKDYATYKRFLLSLKYTIKIIENSINYYQKELYNKNDFIEYKINTFDIEQFNKGIFTDNIKTLYYFNNIKLQKQKIAKSSFNYMRYTLIQNALKEYSKLENIKKDFDSLISSDLNAFEKQFLNKTI